MTDTLRKEFEVTYRACFPIAAELQPNLFSFELDDDEYVEAKVHVAFTLWQAARATAGPVASDAHKFALMCDALPADFSWGEPLTPDVFRHIESALTARDATPVADVRAVVDARGVLTDFVVEKWLDRQGNDSGQGLCDMYTSAVRDGYRLARSTLTDFYATRDAAPSDAQLHIAADEVIRIANAHFGIYPQDDPMRVDFKAAVFNASRDISLDHKRYRALRDRDLDALKTGGVFAGMIPENVVINGTDLDAAADKLLSASAPREKT